LYQKHCISALDVIVSLIEGCETSNSQKYCFVICDNQEAWILNAAGNLWAAEKITEGCRSVAIGLSIGSKIDKQCDNLQEKTKELGLWDGSVSF
jgi:secernin